MFYSEEYLNLIRQEHIRTKKWGSVGETYKDLIKSICKKNDAHKILDYGCGFGSLKKILEPQIQVTNYDPGVEKYSQLPEPHEIVVCFDVLEHIEYDYIDKVLDHIHNLTKKILIATVATTPANRILADGRNAHLIIENIDWWKEKLYLYFKEDFNKDNLFILNH